MNKATSLTLPGPCVDAVPVEPSSSASTSTRSCSSTAIRPRDVRAKGRPVVNSVGPTPVLHTHRPYANFSPFRNSTSPGRTSFTMPCICIAKPVHDLTRYVRVQLDCMSLTDTPIISPPTNFKTTFWPLHPNAINNYLAISPCLAQSSDCHGCASVTLLPLPHSSPDFCSLTHLPPSQPLPSNQAAHAGG